MELASELLSGPDLGGGFLFQLTRDRPPLPAGFTFHLQEAGTDAGESPAGSPMLLGFRHPTVACMYGGPQCWHASYALGAEEMMRVRLAYNRTRFVIGPMLRQAAGTSVAPAEAGLEELLDRILLPLARHGLVWQLGGSAGAWVRGVPLHPADIDLEVANGGAVVLAEALAEYLVVPLHAEESAQQRLGAAAFVGTLKEGIRVEWYEAPLGVAATGPHTEWGPGWEARCTEVDWRGRRIPLAPLAFDLLRAAEKGLTDRVEVILAALRADPRELQWAGMLSNEPGRPPSEAALLQRTSEPDN